MLLSSLFDLFYTIDRVRRGKDVATFQYLSPVLLFTTMVSGPKVSTNTTMIYQPEVGIATSDACKS